MSGDTSAAVAPAAKPLLPLLNAPLEDDGDAVPADSRCCGGGSCSLG